MPKTIGEFVLAKALAGHSVNCAKLYRKTALIWYSRGAWACTEGRPRAKMSRTGKSAEGRARNGRQTLRKLPELAEGETDGATFAVRSFIFALKPPRDFSEDAAGDFPPRGHRAELRMLVVPQVLSHNGKFQAAFVPPGEARVKSPVAGHVGII